VTLQAILRYSELILTENSQVYLPQRSEQRNVLAKHKQQYITTVLQILDSTLVKQISVYVLAEKIGFETQIVETIRDEEVRFSAAAGSRQNLGASGSHAKNEDEKIDMEDFVKE